MQKSLASRMWFGIALAVAVLFAGGEARARSGTPFTGGFRAVIGHGHGLRSGHLVGVLGHHRRQHLRAGLHLRRVDRHRHRHSLHGTRFAHASRSRPATRRPTTASGRIALSRLTVSTGGMVLHAGDRRGTRFRVAGVRISVGPDYFGFRDAYRHDDDRQPR